MSPIKRPTVSSCTSWPTQQPGATLGFFRQSLSDHLSPSATCPLLPCVTLCRAVKPTGLSQPGRAGEKPHGGSTLYATN